MTSLDGIAELHMSGTRAVFRPKRGVRIREGDLAAAFEDQGMELESFERLRRPRPAAVYTVDTGVT